MQFALYLFINLLFVCKYSLRISLPVAAVCCVVYTVFAFLLWKYRLKISGKWLWKGFVLACVLLLVGQYSIDPYTLNVDRWSAIHNQLGRLFSGVYPVDVRTHLGHFTSPFPVWTVLHAPFYGLGNVSLAVFPEFFAFVYSLKRLFGADVAARATALMGLSPAFVYEVLVRSDLLYNMLFVAAFINFLRLYEKQLVRNWVVVGVFCGLVLSSRLSILAPMMIYLLPWWARIGGKRQILFPLIAGLSFAFTFLPFIVWDAHAFFYGYNPFTLQTFRGHPSDFALLLPLLLLAAFSWKGNYVRCNALAGWWLFVAIAVTFIHTMWQDDNFLSLFSSAYDITYLDMGLPFITVSMAARFVVEKKSVGG